MRIEARQLFELGRRRRLPLRDVDLDYLVHCQLGELFGDLTPGPFRIQGQDGRFVELLAYSSSTSAELEARAQTYAEAGAWAACDRSWLRAKAMPSVWPAGHHLGFEVRVCPVVRKASAGPNHRAGAEVDVFLSRAWEAPHVEFDREEVYREWLGQRLEGRGARLLGARLEHFRLARLLRRRQGAQRTAALSDRPDVLLVGRLEVQDPARFQDLLARGVARHRAFGFGMLLLKRA
jgi:CRISPR system Cascade subunit CasE